MQLFAAGKRNCWAFTA